MSLEGRLRSAGAWFINGHNEPWFNPLPKELSDNAAADEQPKAADGCDDQAEISTCISGRKGADDCAGKGYGNYQPICPSQKWDDSGYHQDQGHEADEGCQHAQHGS